MLTGGGALLTVLGGRRTGPARVAGALLVAGSVATRFGIFWGGIASAQDPRYTVVPQRERVEACATSA